MDYDLSYDVSRFLDASVHEVERTRPWKASRRSRGRTCSRSARALLTARAWSISSLGRKRRQSVQEVMDALQPRLSGLKDADIELFPPPSVPGYGNASGFELRLLDKTGRGDFGEMERIVGTFIQDLKARPEIAGAFTIFNASFPQYTLALDMERAAQKGVTAENALATLQTMLGSEYATR